MHVCRRPTNVGRKLQLVGRSFITYTALCPNLFIVAIFYPFSQFCEINISLLSLQKQPNTALNLFQRGVAYGKYVISGTVASKTVLNLAGWPAGWTAAEPRGRRSIRNMML